MNHIEGLQAVVAVAESKSFTKASERLGSSKALVSKYVARIEAEHKIKLFNRSTRSVVLTEAGDIFLQHARALLEKFVELQTCVNSQTPIGTLRVSAPISFCEHHLAPRLVEFCQQHPSLNIEVIARNQSINMIDEGIDVRIKAGQPEDSRLVARQFSTSQLVLVGHNNYLAQVIDITVPADLTKLKYIVDSNHDGKNRLILKRGAEAVSVDLAHQLTVNTPATVMNCVLAQGGIGLVPDFLAHDAIASGLVSRVLPDWQTRALGVYVMYPHREYLPQKTRLFVDFLIESFAS